MSKCFVYRFKNKDNDIIYVGGTISLERRLKEHFCVTGHLPQECYQETTGVGFLAFENLFYN